MAYEISNSCVPEARCETFDTTAEVMAAVTELPGVASAGRNRRRLTRRPLSGHCGCEVALMARRNTPGAHAVPVGIEGLYRGLFHALAGSIVNTRPRTAVPPSQNGTGAQGLPGPWNLGAASVPSGRGQS
jgi:hypothetical protein